MAHQLINAALQQIHFVSVEKIGSLDNFVNRDSAADIQRLPHLRTKSDVFHVIYGIARSVHSTTSFGDSMAACSILRPLIREPDVQPIAGKDITSLRLVVELRLDLSLP